MEREVDLELEIVCITRMNVLGSGKLVQFLSSHSHLGQLKLLVLVLTV